MKGPSGWWGRSVVLFLGAWLPACTGWLASGTPAAPAAPRVLRAVQIAAEWESTCAVSVDGDVYCWGSECHGAPVDGLFDLVCSWPKKVSGLSHIQSIALGGLMSHDCALDENGAVWCGSPQDGFARVELPRATAIANATAFACALLVDGTVSCWNAGIGKGGKLVAMPIPGLADVATIAARSGRALAVDRAGVVHAFRGPSEKGQPAVRLAVDPIRSLSMAEYHPYLDIHVDLRRFDASARDEGGHTCALLVSGGVRCWGGRNERGQLGMGRACDEDRCSTDFADVVDVRLPELSPVVSVTTGLEHACALHESGNAYCWGNNATGELGGRTRTWFSGRPVQVGGGFHFIQLAAANNHTCGIVRGGEIVCWGQNEDGQLGRAARTPWTMVAAPVAF